MGEARRRKLAGNTEPDPNYQKQRKMTRREIAELMPGSMTEAMALLMAAKLRSGKSREC